MEDEFDDMKRMRKEMTDLFDLVFGRSGAIMPIPYRGMVRRTNLPQERAPLIDLIDNKDSYTLIAELPGMEKADINIEVDGDNITLSAIRKDKTEDRQKNYYYSERSYSSYRRTFQLPSPIKPDSVDAHYHNGVLEVNMKKKGEHEKKHKVDVK